MGRNYQLGATLTNINEPKFEFPEVDTTDYSDNGDGFESWENVWGTWNGMVPRDGEATRRVGAMLRYLGSEHAGAIIRSPLWEPHTPRAVTG